MRRAWWLPVLFVGFSRAVRRRLSRKHA